LVESVFEYGSRVGGWRLLRLFRRFGVKVCLLAVAKAAERNPALTRAFVADGHEIVSHGYRWLDYQRMPPDEEKEHVRLGIETLDAEGADKPKLMSLAVHDRLIGRPGRITGLVRFLDHIAGRDRVWICTGRDIAEHWRRVHPE